ncbi:MAG TPA: kelch repeat-containing protein [Actinomycetota bacterium]|nr:kelch repeat-containing protein [Actinomycetota bacterium]
MSRIPAALAATLALTAACGGDTPPPIEVAERSVVWRSLAPAPTPRTEVAAAVLGDDRIVVAGGFAAPARTVNVVEIYEPSTDTWTPGPALPVEVNHAMGASLDGRAYIFGGFDAGGAPTTRAFVLEDDAWAELPPMPEPRGAGGAAVADGKIYLVGGVGPAGLAASTLVFDAEGNDWSIAPALLNPREHLGVAAFEDRVYAVGGRTGGLGGNLTDAELFDPQEGSWTAIARAPTARGGIAAAATSNGFVVAPGGEAPEGTFEEAEAYEVAQDRWLALPPMPTPRHGLGVVAIGTIVYALLGGPEPGLEFSGATEAIDLGALPTETPR